MANKPKFAVGTIVKLKSGGPEMTVQKATVNVSDQFTGSYRCQWFAGKKAEADIFPEDSLEVVQPEAEGE